MNIYCDLMEMREGSSRSLFPVEVPTFAYSDYGQPYENSVPRKNVEP